MTRRVLLALLALILVASACSVSETLTEPWCSRDSGTAWIAAQSVPTAQLLPCFDPLPTGWETERVTINNTGTIVTFDSDRAGGAAARFTFSDTCDIGDAVSTPSEYAETERFELVLEVSPQFRAKRHYRFEGGCVTWDFDFDASTPSAISVELGQSMRLPTRKEVNDYMRLNFIDEEL
jgi:hypothetical protein